MFVEDHSAYLADFAVSCTVAGQAVQAIFDNGYALGSVGVTGIAGAQPALTLPSSVLGVEPVGQAVTINALAYTVAAHEPDGTGMSRLLLERA